MWVLYPLLYDWSNLSHCCWGCQSYFRWWISTLSEQKTTWCSFPSRHMLAAVDERGEWKEKKSRLLKLVKSCVVTVGIITKGAPALTTVVWRFICHHPSDPLCHLIRRRIHGCGYSCGCGGGCAWEQRLILLGGCISGEAQAEGAADCLHGLPISQSHCLRRHHAWWMALTITVLCL